jgi:GNAT superfamily N-acetyltransferase
VHRWLAGESYWAAGRDRAVVERSVANSLSFGVYDGTTQVAYGRVVTDHATFAWVCDVFVDAAVRGRGVGGWLMRSIVEHLHGEGVYRILLVTRDAHGVYAGAGFTPLARPEQWMELDTRSARP